MQNVKRCLSLLILGATIGVTQVSAQNLRDVDGPAEYPPASFKGKQYVDSKGCVFIRAGVDGATTWVPRVARNRKLICGFQPTQVAGSSAPSAPRSTAGVTVITAAEPENTGATARPAANASRQVAAAAPKPKPRLLKPARSAAPVTSAPVVIQPAAVAGPATRPQVPQSQQQVVRVAPAAQAPAKRPRYTASLGAPKVATNVAPCAGAAGSGGTYMGNTGLEVRCGGQNGYDPVRTRQLAGQLRPAQGGEAPRYAAPSGLTAPQYGAQPMPQYGAAPAAPRHAAAPANSRRVFEVPKTKVVRVAPATATHQSQIHPQARVMPRPAYENRVMTQGVQVPKGYKPVWDDDRLNPYRAEQTLAGKRQMERIWSQDVPRELNKVVLSPGYGQPQYQQPQYRQPQYQQPQYQQKYQKPRYGVQGHVSSRGVAPQTKPKAQVQPQAATGRFVQVGTFGNVQNAQNTAQRLAASGLPMRIAKQGNRRVVMAGPFANDRDIAHALAAARRAGFYDAFPRR